MQTKDFKGQDLRGKSFKNQDLTGADFSDCDLRGVDFSFANLTDAKFCNAKMGRTLKIIIFLSSLQFVLGILAGFILILFNIFLSGMFDESLKYFKVFDFDTYNKFNSHMEVSIFLVNFQALILFFISIDAVNKKRWTLISWIFILAILIQLILSITADLSMTTSFKFLFVFPLSVIGIGAIAIGSAFGIVALFSIAISRVTSLASIITIIVVTIMAFSIVDIVEMFTSEKIKPNEYGLATYPLVSVVLGGTIYIALGSYLGWRARKKEESHLLFLRELSLKTICFNSTNFSFSVLKNTDFLCVDLKQVNFKNAQISHCKFEQSKNHHLALTDGTPLEPRKVRDLVIDGIITDKNFATLDLRGLDFSNLNLQDFDFSHANLSGANLSHTQMTGATLEGWNIDTETRLDDIECRYYYYLENGAKKRMPPEGEEYSAGEFTRIFQKIANTIDFIAHNEMELAAIKLSVEQVRVESGNDDIRVQAIEEKDGFIVVKVTVPKTEDRGVLYHEVNVLKQDYEAKIQALTKENYIQIGKIETLREELEKQRKDLLAAIKPNISFENSTFNNNGLANLGEINGNVSQQNTK